MPSVTVTRSSVSPQILLTSLRAEPGQTKENAPPSSFSSFSRRESQTEAVHGHHAEAHICDLKERAGMDRAAFIGRDGKGHLLDHAPQHLLLHGNGIFILNLRQIRVIRSGPGQNVKIRIAAETWTIIFSQR